MSDIKINWVVHEKIGPSQGNFTAISKAQIMPGNILTITLNAEKYSWYIGDSKIDTIVAILNLLGQADKENPLGENIEEIDLEQILTCDVDIIRTITKKIYDKETSHGQDEATGQTE